MTPFMRVAPVSRYGFSVGDAFLILGGLVVLAEGALSGGPRTLVTHRAVALLGAGALIVVAVLLSASINQTAPTFDTSVLVLQYSLSLIFLPVVLGQFGAFELVSYLKAFVYGLATSVALGLIIVTYLPALGAALTERGYMVAIVTGRQGLFSGVGELSKMAAMALPIVYYLVMREAITIRRAAALLCGITAATVVTRSGLGFIAAVAAICVVAVWHVALRSQLRITRPKGITIKAMALLLSGLAGSALLISQLDTRGFDYATAFTHRVTNPLTQDSLDSVGSGQLRLQLINQAWSVINKHFLGGIGPGLYAPQAIQQQGVHVVPLMMWAETGILALVGWLLIVGTVSLGIFTAARRAPWATVSAAGVFAAFLVTNFSLPYMYPRGLLMPILLSFFLLAYHEETVQVATVAVPKLVGVADRAPAHG